MRTSAAHEEGGHRIYAISTEKFTGPEHTTLVADLGVEFTARDTNFATPTPGIYITGDMGRGQSLIVWAIAEGHATAANVDHYLAGKPHYPPQFTNPLSNNRNTWRISRRAAYYLLPIGCLIAGCGRGDVSLT